MYKSPCEYLFPFFILKSRMAGSYSRNMFNFLRNYQLFYKVVVPFYVSTCGYKSSNSSTFSPKLIWSIFLMVAN